jgi:anti-sigma B factor antagonist
MPDALTRPDSNASRADALSPAFVCSWTEGGRDAAWVRIAGELDLATAPELERTLEKPPVQARLVVLDLRELSFIDSSGVHAIVNASSRARQAGRRLVVLRGPPQVDRLFALTGSSGELEISDLEPEEPPIQVLLRLAEDELVR